MSEPGLDRHEWETEWEQLEPDLEDSPSEALNELDDLIGRMLTEAGYPLDTQDPVDDEGIDPEVITSFLAARETTHNKVNADLGRPDDPATKALFEFLGTALKK